MPANPLTQLTLHPFAEAFSHLPTPALLLDNDGNIVAGSAGLAALLPAGLEYSMLVGQSLRAIQAQAGPVATAWAYAHSAVGASPWMPPPSLLPVASSAALGQPLQWWQPVLTRLAVGSKTNTYWLATAHIAVPPPSLLAARPPAEPADADQLRDTLAHLPGYVLTLRGSEHRISYEGPKVAALLGQDHLQGRLAADVLSALPAPAVLSALDNTYQTGQPFVAHRLLLPDGKGAPRCINVSLHPLRDATQQVTGVLVFGQDAGSGERAVPALVAAPYYQDIVENLPQITSISSAEGVVEYLSPQWFAYTGQTADTLHTHDWVEALDPDDWAEVLQQLPDYLRQGKPWNWQARIRRHDGQYRQHLTQMRPVRNEAGKISRWFGVMVDVQAHHPAPLSQENLKITDAYQELTNTLPQLIWTLAPDGTINSLNQAAKTYSNTDGQPADQKEHSPFPGEDIVRALVEARHSFRPGEVWEQQSLFRRPDGEVRWFLHRARPTQDADGNVTQWYGTSTDIHELKQTTLQQEQHYEDLLRSNRELDAFVRAAASELRQPIHNLQALFGQMREAVTFHDPDANALLVMADNSLRRWDSTVRNLMQLVKVQEQQELPPEELSLATLTREALLGLHPHLRASGGEVSTHFQSLPTVSYVRPHLLSIITNLLSNSLRHHDPSRPLRLRLESKPSPSGRAQLVVQDNGLGMEPSRSEDPTGRTELAANGSGTNLYLIHRIVEGHGGRLEVQSVPGEGTTFCVTL